jgi:uncharacterized protein (TIGR02217 family)
MAFDEVQFPPEISYGSAGGPGFNTAIIEVDSGAEERVSRWTSARRRYNVGYGVKSHDDLHTLITFYIARRGAANGFRFKDWLDYTSASNGRDTPDDEDQAIGTGDASETQFQLIKKYTSGGVTRTRTIEKPTTGTTVIAFDGVAQSTGWSVSTATGIVTFDTAPGSGVAITAGFAFDVPVRFGEGADQLLNLSIEAFDIGSAPDIELVEIIDEGELDEEYHYGGGSYLAISTDTQLAISDGRSLVVNCSASGKYVKLPDPSGLVAGGPYFYIYNEGANSILVKDYGGNTLVTLAQDDACVAFIGLVSSTLTWFTL